MADFGASITLPQIATDCHILPPIATDCHRSLLIPVVHRASKTDLQDVVYSNPTSNENAIKLEWVMLTLEGSARFAIPIDLQFR